MIDLSFDNGTVEQFTLVLSSRDYTKLGQLSNVRNLKFTENLNSANEISFEICKQLDDHEEVLWDEVYDLRLIWVRELDEYYEIRVELTDQVYKTKTVTCTSLCECELSQAGLYNIEINTADDIARPDYDVEYPTVFYRILPADKTSEEYKKKYNSSLLHRILDKVPAYSIAHVDSSLMNLQRTFSISNTTVYDFLTGDCSEQFNCLFQFDTTNRTVSAYDLYTVCNDCGHRGDFRDVCPECGSTNLKYFGEDTTIFVSTDNLTDEVQFDTDVDSIKNAFRLEAGDDNMTAAVINSNPSGSRYIYEFSDEARRDMPEELVEKMDDYDDEYNYYNNEYEMTLDTATRTAFNDIASKYSLNTCQICGERGTFTTCTNCGSMLVTQQTWETIPQTVVGYKNLIPFYYECIDLYSYLKSSMMPQVIIPQTTVANEISKLEDLTSGIPSSNLSVSRLAQSTVVATMNTAMVNWAKTMVLTGFVKVTVDTDNSGHPNSFTYTGSTTESGVTVNHGIWKGRFKVTNYTDDTDFDYTRDFEVNVDDNFGDFVEQKIVKQLSKAEEYAYEVLKLIKNPRENVTFKDAIRLYSANRLQSFHDAIEAVIGILIDAGQGNDGTVGEKSLLYDDFYTPYYQAMADCADELNLRNQEIETIWGSYDSDGLIVKEGMIQYIATEVTNIHKHLDFQAYVGEDLYKVYTTYIREETYSNSNYISDGLDNNQLFDNARQFLERAREELHKSATYQHSIKSNLNNLLAIDEFKPLLNKFELGNWIRVQCDETVYRLRLISYSIDFDNLQKINTEFSDVTITANGLNDIQSIIKQASSMTSSYGYVEKQAEQGSQAKVGFIDDWVQNGLNSALVRINNNNDEDIRIDETGITARTYDDVSETYDDEQLRITHNVLAFTDDGWKSVRTALGKFEMTHHEVDEDPSSIYYGLNMDATKIKRYTTYGLVADAVLAGWIVGSHMESSTIIASHMQVAGNESYIDMSDVTTTGKNYFIKYQDKFLVDKNGNAKLIGEIYANSGRIGNWTLLPVDSTYFYGAGALYYKDSTSDIMGYNAYTALLSPKGCTMKPGANQTRFGWKAETANDEETFILGVGQHFGVNTEGKLYAKDINVSGKVVAESGQIGAWHVDPLSSDSTTYEVGSGALYYNAGNVTNTYFLAPNGTKNNYTLSNPDISSRKWNIRFGNNFGIDTNGNAFLCGTIYANAGKIGNFVIKSDGVHNYLGNALGTTYAVGMSEQVGNYYAKLYAWQPSASTMIYPGRIDIGGGSLRVYNGVYREGNDREGSTSGDYISINHSNIYNSSRNTNVVWWDETDSISDARAKDNIKTVNFNNIQSVFKELNPIEFDYNNLIYKKTGKTKFGLIAQDAQIILDKYLPNTDIVFKRDDGYYAINYFRFIGLLIASTKDLYQHIEYLENKIIELKGENNG